jgi:hypothetical protein
MHDSEFSLLALEIQQDNPELDIDTAWKMAWQQMPELLDLVMTDARYRPARVVVFDLLTVDEMIDATGGIR